MDDGRERQAGPSATVSAPIPGPARMLSAASKAGAQAPSVGPGATVADATQPGGEPVDTVVAGLEALIAELGPIGSLPLAEAVGRLTDLHDQLTAALAGLDRT